MDEKVETARFAGRHELPFAPTAENAEQAFEFAKKYRLPLIGKPRAGNGSRGVVILRSKEEIARAFAARSDLIAQPFLDPPSNMDSLIAPFEEGLPFFFSFPETRQYTVRVPVGPDGTISPPFGCLTTLVMGRSSQYSRCEEPDLLEISRAYAVAAAEEGWRGPLNLQFKRTAEGYLMGHELNGRFGGGIAARAKLGFDEIAEVFNRFLPGMPFPSLAESRSDVAEQYPCAHAVLREGLAALRKSGKWARAGK